MAAKKKDSKAKQILMSVFRYLVASISAAIAFYVLFALIFSTEEEKRLQKENRLYNNLFDGMKAKEELIGDVVEGLLEKDDAIYEELFSTAPPSMDELGTHRAAAITDNVSLPEKYYVRSASAQSDSLMRIASSVDANFSEIGASVGMKQSPMYDLQVHHDGLDIIAPQGTKVYAAAPGRVSRVVRSRMGLGNEVEIDHGNGYVTRYTLLGDIFVTQGRSIKVGQELGTVGISTLVSAPHLHFEVRYKGELRDPIDYFFASLSPEEYYRMRFMAAKTLQSMD